MEISRALSNITGSATAEIFAQAKELESKGQDIVHLEIGQPDFQPLDIIIEATKKALDEGKTAYTVSRGTSELRTALVNYYASNTDLTTNEVIITAGGKLSVFGSVWSVTNPGDNIIVLNPSWVSYADIIASLGGEVRFLPVDSNFKFDEEKLISLIDDRTTAILVNSPSNPTGAIISEKDMRLLYNICMQHNLLLISDEMYDEYIYEGNHVSLMKIPNWKENGVVINGFSKTFSMTGFRLGYALSNQKIINQINKVQQLTTSCPVNFSQSGAIAAIENIDLMREEIKKIMHPRRKLANELLMDIDVEYLPPAGAIYLWLGIDTNNSVEWSKKLLIEEGVATTPGRAFGPDGEGYVRLCFATDENSLEEGINRLGKFVKQEKV